MPKINGNAPISKIPYRQQSSIGGKESFWRVQSPKDTPDNTVFFARVLKVNYLAQTVQYIPESNYLGQSFKFNVENQNSGLQNAKVPTKFWGENIDGNAFGENQFIQQGSRILVTYIEGDQSRPIVLGVYSPDDINNTSELAVVNQSEMDDSNYDTQESAWTSRTVYPNMQFKSITGNGNYTRTFNGSSFLKVSNDPLKFMGSQFYGLSSDSSNLRIDGSEITPVDTEAQAILLRHASNVPDDNHDSRFYLDNDGGLHYSFFDTEQKGATFVDYSKDTGVIITRTMDTNTKDDSKSFLEVFLGDTEGLFKAVSHTNGADKSISLGSGGFTVDGNLLVTEGSFDQLSQQFKKLSGDFEKLQDAIDSIGLDFITGLPNTIEQINIQLGKLNRELSTAKETAESAVSTANATDARLTTFSSNINQAISEMNATLTNVKAEMDDYKANKASYKKVVTDVNTMSPKVDKAITDISGLQTLTKSHTSTLSTHESRIEVVEDSSKSHATSITNINGDIEKLHTKDTAQDKLVTDLTGRVATLESSNAQLTRALKELTARVVALETKP